MGMISYLLFPCGGGNMTHVDRGSGNMIHAVGT